MAVVSTHILNGVDGSHAGGIAVRLVNVATRETVFDTKTDDGGRLVQDIAAPDAEADYELVLDVEDYWSARGNASRMKEIVLRFRMPDPDGAYHSPLIISPNGYSVWLSA